MGCAAVDLVGELLRGRLAVAWLDGRGDFIGGVGDSLGGLVEGGLLGVGRDGLGDLWGSVSGWVGLERGESVGGLALADAFAAGVGHDVTSWGWRGLVEV